MLTHTSILLAATLLNFFAGPAIALPALVTRDDDPFYTPPSGWTNQKAGTILKTRQIYNPSYVQYAAANLANTYQYLIRSNDQDNNAVPVVTTLFVPQNSERGANDRLVTHLAAYDTPYNLASPSYSAYNNTLGAPDGILIAFYLNKGWYVNFPDYESTLGGFANGPLSGQATLDSITAVLSTTSSTGLRNSAYVAIEGASGGALAGEWAAELQASYAPGLAFNIVGYALGSLTPFIGNVYKKIDGQLPAGLAVAAVLGIQNTVKNFSNWLAYGLASSTSAKFRSAEYMNGSQITLAFAGQNISAYFNEGPSWINDQIPRDTLSKVGTMGQNWKNPPGVPMYFYKGAKDEISDINDTQYLYNLYCGGNIRSLTFNVSSNLAHIEASYFGIPAAAKFIEDRFNGVAAPSGCTQVSNTKGDSFDSWDAQYIGQAYLSNLQNTFNNNGLAGF